MRRVHILLLLSLLLISPLGAPLVGPSEAQAGPNDFHLDKLSPCAEGTEPGTSCQAIAAFADDHPTFGVEAQQSRERFKKFSLALGQVFAPNFLSPAESLGEAGFAFGFQTKFSVASSGDYWFPMNSVSGDASTDETQSPPLFTLIQLQARKGLPFSFELEASLAHLIDSEMIWMGGSVKWALQEGFVYIPDLAVRGFGGVLTGAPDLNLVTAGFDVSLSKSFGLGGLFSLTPYAGYSLVFVIASSRVLDADPGVGLTPSGAYAPEFVFGQSTQAANRGFIGLRFIVDFFSLSFEGNFNANVQNYGLNLGFDF